MNSSFLLAPQFLQSLSRSIGSLGPPRGLHTRISPRVVGCGNCRGMEYGLQLIHDDFDNPSLAKPSCSNLVNLQAAPESVPAERTKHSSQALPVKPSATAGQEKTASSWKPLQTSTPRRRIRRNPTPRAWRTPTPPASSEASSPAEANKSWSPDANVGILWPMSRGGRYDAISAIQASPLGAWSMLWHLATFLLHDIERIPPSASAIPLMAAIPLRRETQQRQIWLGIRKRWSVHPQKGYDKPEPFMRQARIRN